MKIVQTYWTKPALKSNAGRLNAFDRFNGGWADKRFNYFSWALSCLQLLKFYDEVELVTDNDGYKVLIEKIGLPYTKVLLGLNGLEDYGSDVWALGKIYTYSIQDSPFLHVDGDVFIWERFEDRLETAALVCQNIEHDFPFYSNAIEEVQRSLTFIPQAILDDRKIHTAVTACNAGILGGTDLAFFREYVVEAFRFVENNAANLDKINSGWFNTIYEQYLFWCLATEKQMDIEVYLEDVTPHFDGIADFTRVRRDAHFVHMLGNNKKVPEKASLMEQRLRSDYPEYYYKIVNLLWNQEI